MKLSYKNMILDPNNFSRVESNPTGAFWAKTPLLQDPIAGRINGDDYLPVVATAPGGQRFPAPRRTPSSVDASVAHIEITRREPHTTLRRQETSLLRTLCPSLSNCVSLKDVNV